MSFEETMSIGRKTDWRKPDHPNFLLAAGSVRGGLKVVSWRLVTWMVRLTVHSTRGTAHVGGLCLVLLLTGCASYRHPPMPSAGLAERLRGLSTSVDWQEAALTAETACVYSLELARQYRAVRPTWWNNVLINTGFKRRGLCFEYAEDLSAKLATLHLRTLLVRHGVASQNTRLESNCLVLTAVGQPFDCGIVLDAWRYEGRLHWCDVNEDKDYPWVEARVVDQGAAAPPHAAKGR
jgi:hypothetical protein